MRERSQAETRPSNLPLPKQCQSWPIPGASPHFSNSSLWHCQTSPVLLLLFSKFASCSQIILSLSPEAWTIFSPILLLQSHFGTPSPPTEVNHRRPELFQVTAPMEMIRKPVQTTFPFPAQISGNSSLPTFAQLA